MSLTSFIEYLEQENTKEEEVNILFRFTNNEC
jgi:hypothetical protein